jgi:uncharacterized protein (DUF983 family)
VPPDLPQDVAGADKSAATGILRGALGYCPNCGSGKLFAGFLRVLAPCPVCGSDNERFPADDFPPYLTIAVVLHLTVPVIVWAEVTYMPALWLQAAVWLPFSAAFSLALLPRMKGATIGFCWAKNIFRPGGESGG